VKKRGMLLDVRAQKWGIDMKDYQRLDKKQESS
jgi:hypothetical protein